jgi:hypothetical protein
MAASAAALEFALFAFSSFARSCFVFFVSFECAVVSFAVGELAALAVAGTPALPSFSLAASGASVEGAESAEGLGPGLPSPKVVAGDDFKKGSDASGIAPAEGRTRGLMLEGSPGVTVELTVRAAGAGSCTALELAA